MSGTVGGSTYILTFQNQSVVQGMAQTQQQVAQSSAAIANSLNQIIAALNATSSAAQGTSGVLGSGGGVGGSIAGALGGSAGLLGTLTTLTTGLGLATFALHEIRDAFSFVKEGVLDFNDQLAKSHIVWETFTGDTKAADAQVAALFEFSRTTPFTFEQVDAASRQLAAFGGVAFASKENLELLGNVAAGTQKPLQTITYEFGQMYQEIENGQPFGRAARALVQFGALTAETRNHLEAMQAAGASTDEMLKIFTGDLDRFNGIIDKQATQTLSGAMTTLTDTVQSLIAVAGKGIFDEIIGGINGINKAAESDNAFRYAQNFGIFVKEILDGMALIINGATFFIDLMQGLWTTLIIVMLEGIDKILSAWGKLPGQSQYAEMAKGLEVVIGALQSGLRDINSKLTGAGDDIIEAWNGITSAKWVDAGSKAAGNFQQGFTAKFSAGDEDAEEAARAYMSSITSAFANFTPDQIGSLDKLTGFVSTMLLGSSKDPSQIIQDIKPLLISAIAGLNDDVNQGLAALKNVLPPEVFAQVEKYIDSMHNADLATRALTVATLGADAAQDKYNDTLADAKEAQSNAAEAVETAKNTLESNSAVFDRQVKAQEEILTGVRQKGEAEASRLSENIRVAQNALNQLSESVAQHARDDAARIEEQQRVVDNKQKLQEEHEAAFAAILSGETQRFLEQKGAIDATTQAILDRYNAEVEGKIRAAAGDDQRVTRLEREERAKLLELDTRIRQERAAGHFKEAENLQTQRDRVAAYYDDQIKYASQIAAVSKDKADEAKERVDKAAEASKDKDQKDVDAATVTLNNIKDEVKARAEADRIALAAAKERVDQAQEEARISAADYKQREQDIANNIADIKKRQDAQEIADKVAVAGAEAAKKVVDAIWTKAVADAKDTLTAAKGAEQAAKDTKTAMDLQLTSMEKITAEWQKQYSYALGILNAEREARGLDPVKVIAPAPTPPQQNNDPNPNTGLNSGDTGMEAKPAPPVVPPPTQQPPPVVPPPSTLPSAIPPTIKPGAPVGAPPLLFGLANPTPPPGYHSEWDDQGMLWQVPDKYHLEDYGHKSGPKPSSSSGEEYYTGGGLSAMLAAQTPSPLAAPALRAGMFGSSMPYETVVKGQGPQSVRILEGAFANTTVDSPQRVEEIKTQVLAGIRQGLGDYISNNNSSRIGRKL
jgi:hypothetical protein